jgi:hypothetical protein
MPAIGTLSGFVTIFAKFLSKRETMKKIVAPRPRISRGAAASPSP